MYGLPAHPFPPYLISYIRAVFICARPTVSAGTADHRCGPASPSYDIHDMTCGMEPPVRGACLP